MAKLASVPNVKKISANSIDTDPIPNQRRLLTMSDDLDVAPIPDPLPDRWLFGTDSLLIVVTGCRTN